MLTKFNLKSMFKELDHTAVQHTFTFGYKNKAVFAVEESNPFLFQKPYKTHKYNVWDQSRGF